MPEESLYGTDILPVRILGSHEPQNVTEPHIFAMYSLYALATLQKSWKVVANYYDEL
jgi:benzoyl-CoA reductase subunit C